MKALIQVAASFTGGLGFSLIFGLHGKQLPVAATGSACTWLVYLACIWLGGNDFLAVLLASAFGSIYSTVLAEILKVPKTVFLFSVIISLVPGSDLYHTMCYAVEGELPLFFHSFVKTLSASFAIAIGMIAVLAGEQMYKRRKLRRP